MRTVKRLCLHLANATAYSRGLEQSSGTSFYLIAQWGSQLIQDWKKIDRKSRDEHDSKRFAIRLNYTAPRRSSTLFSWANILTEACPSLELSKKSPGDSFQKATNTFVIGTNHHQSLPIINRLFNFCKIDKEKKDTMRESESQNRSSRVWTKRMFKKADLTNADSVPNIPGLGAFPS